MTTTRRSRFPLPLDAVVERKPAPERTAGMPAIESPRKPVIASGGAGVQTPPNALKSALTPALKPMSSALQRARKPVPPPQPVMPGSAVEARASAATAGGGGMASDRARGALVARLRASGIRDARVLHAIGTVPRHLFVEPGLASQAYEDAALPIGHQQTISKPSVVARMIELLREGLAPDQPLARVLEIGTGCGYQAAVLSLAAEEVFSIERIRPLHEQAKANLRPLRLPNVRLHYGDGMLGLPQAAPFSSIILAAAGMEVPEALLEQLAIGGRLIAPVAVSAATGGQGGAQQLLLIERQGRHRFHRTALEAVFFVPLKSGTI